MSSVNLHRRSSLRLSFSAALIRKSLILRSKAVRLKGRNLFRAAVRLVLQYFEWLTEEPVVDDIGDDIAVNIRMAQQKKVDKKGLTVKDRSILLMKPEVRTAIEETYIFDLFKKLRAFRKYSDYLKEALARICVYQYLPPGRVIVRQGHPAENLYFIANGEVSLSRVVVDKWTGESKEIDMGTLNPGDIFGEIALLHTLPRSATVISETIVDLFLIPRQDFNDILRCTLTEEWDVLQDALVHFNYFKCWDVETIRECCILSRIKDFEPDQILLGDGKGMVNYVHFILDGECRLIEHMLVREQVSNLQVQYELYDPDTLTAEEKETTRSLRKLESTDERPKCLGRKATHIDSIAEGSMDRESLNYSNILLSKRPADKRVDSERTSIITTTLLDVENEWHEITDVAAMLMREPSSISQQCYPNDVHTIFMQICIFYRGACFGLGENMQNRRIVSTTPVRCFLIPRYWLREHNRANIWERVRLFMDSKYPSKKQMFKEFVAKREWIKYKDDLVNDITKTGRHIRSNVTMHDVPYSIRITNDIHLKM